MTPIIVYSLPVCPRCEELKKWLGDHSIPFTCLDMGSAEGITELRVNQCFAMEAPVLRIGDTFYESADLWTGGVLNDTVLQGAIR
jgi:Glutaredoxin and related proteins